MSSIKINTQDQRERQWFREIAALPEDQSSSSSTHVRWFTSTYISSLWRPESLFWPLLASAYM